MDTAKTDVLFITDKAYVDYNIAGGVQLCTGEFINYFEQAGYTVNVLKVQPVISTIKKLRIKLGIEAYSLYELSPYVNDIVSSVKAKNIKIVLFNQISLAHWAADLKKHLPTDVKFICLSHGNESGDFLHHITQTQKPTFTHTWRLGRLLIREKQIFGNLDGVITISEQEAATNSWIGAKQILYLPRILKPAFINWGQNNTRVGFVGTLDHLPNIEGVRSLARELKKSNFKAEFVLVGGPESVGQQLAKEFPFIKYKGPLSSTQLINEVQIWAVFLNPVFWYARGSSTKLAQAINWGIPVISTPAGARGYQLSNKAILTEDNTPASFAKAVTSALINPESLLGLKKSAEVNSADFDIELWASRLESFIKQIAAIKN
ncbi:MAG: glycosyltransferase [Bacteroidota bacterium]